MTSTSRVIQWASGAMGTATLRAVIDSPDTELVGLLVYGEGKVGKDAGDLARRPATGVLATASVEEVLALEADVVIHSARLGPYGIHDDDLVRILRSGKNVISINGYTHPRDGDPERVERLQAAAEEGGVTLTGAGLNPGFIGEQMAVVASGLCIDLDAVEVVEYVDCGDVQQAPYLFGVLGFATPAQEARPQDPDWGPARALRGMFAESIASIAHGLGIELDGIESDHRVHLAPEDVHLAAGTVPAGTASHTNWRWHGMLDGRRCVSVSIHWYVEPSHLPRQDPPFWELHVSGHPGVRMSIDLEKHPDDASRMSVEQYAVAGSVLNTIPVVRAAAPGLLTRPAATPFRAPRRDA